MNQPTTETLVSLVRDFLDPDPCQFDHHGYCQAHAAGFGGEPGSCPHGRARKLLAAIDAAAPAPVSADGQRRDRMRRALSTTRPSSLSSKHGPTEITAELDALVTAALGVADAEHEALRLERNALRRQVEQLRRADAEQQTLRADYDEERAERKVIQGKNARLRAENKQLRTELAEEMRKHNNTIAVAAGRTVDAEEARAEAARLRTEMERSRAAERIGQLRGVANYLQQRGADLNDGGLTAAADLLRRVAGEEPAAFEAGLASKTAPKAASKAGEEPATTETQDRAAIRAEAFRDAAGWAYLNVHASAAEGVRRWLLALADEAAAVARQDGET